MPRYNYPGYKPTREGWLGARRGTRGSYHGGADNPADAGTPVYAEHAGRVFRSGPINGYGMSVIVQSTAADGTPFYELYGHLGPAQLPSPGTEIVAGSPIPGAEIGTKDYVRSQGGITSGPHLHREIILGKPPLNKEGGLGIYSSDIARKADPDTFDINHPVFPYAHGEPLPSPQVQVGGGGLMPPGERSPRAATHTDARRAVPDESSLTLVPGMAIPGAVGPTSIGGPNGPTPVVPPASWRTQPSVEMIPDADVPPAPLHFAPEVPRDLGLSSLPISLYPQKPLLQNGPDQGTAAHVISAERDEQTGIPGLLSIIAGAEPTNPFRPAAATVAVPERRLVSRLVY